MAEEPSTASCPHGPQFLSLIGIQICRLRWDWELPIPELDTSVLVLPVPITKASAERVVVLNSVARRIIDSRRRKHEKYVFSYRGRRLSKLHSSAWKPAWRNAGLPVERDIRKGVHNLRHYSEFRIMPS